MSQDTRVPWEEGVRKGGLMNQDVMKKNMLDFKRVMDKHGIHFALIFGSLLGAIREGKPIDWDSDADVACFEHDHRKIHRVITDLQADGFAVVPKDYCPIHDHFVIRDGEKIDIWWFCDTGTEWFYDKNIRYPKKYFDKLDKMEFLGDTFRIPNNPEEFLTVTYGEDWRTPNKNKEYIIGR